MVVIGHKESPKMEPSRRVIKKRIESKMHHKRGGKGRKGLDGTIARTGGGHSLRDRKYQKRRRGSAIRYFK